MNIADILFTRRCPFCDKIIALTESVCEDCRGKLSEPFKRSIGGSVCACAFPYDGDYRNAILKYKFGGKHFLADVLSEYMCSATDKIIGGRSFDYITYVPQYRAKKYKFNHSKLLAKKISKRLSVPCRELLIKTVKTAKQHKLNLIQRKTNVKHAFSATRDLSGKSVLLVDDITTTGYTLSECIYTLKNAGASQVCSVTFCGSRLRH